MLMCHMQVRMQCKTLKIKYTPFLSVRRFYPEICIYLSQALIGRYIKSALHVLGSTGLIYFTQKHIFCKSLILTLQSRSAGFTLYMKSFRNGFSNRKMKYSVLNFLKFKRKKLYAMNGKTRKIHNSEWIFLSRNNKTEFHVGSIIQSVPKLTTDLILPFVQ